MFEGAIAAMVTPFTSGQVDWPALRQITRHLLAGRLDGIVVLGSTGEGATCSAEERRRILEVVLEEAQKRAFVIAGTGTNATDSTIQLTRDAKEAGADGVLLVTPYYNKPTPEGLYRHYEAVARAVDLPIVLYNVPSRTALNMKPETVAKLARIPQVVAIKESAGSLDQGSELIQETKLTVISGDDSLCLPMMAIGAKGVISVVANVVPGDVKALVDAMARGDLAAARPLHHRLYPLVKAMFLETNPAPVKHALKLLGLTTGELRLPLVPVTEATARQIEEALRTYGLEVGAAA